jgi:hypothetical protein
MVSGVGWVLDAMIDYSATVAWRRFALDSTVTLSHCLLWHAVKRDAIPFNPIALRNCVGR